MRRISNALQASPPLFGHAAPKAGGSQGILQP
eukprot:CAMPEP_0115353736 /NCGR_PEP_ID=MMETSP0270-20121206/98200_1 /TAXON_ID=71861 /ORGANISM="Scrippsiella trochoidea, Strain CCMP3099" /LENGTH=31 /DNA_ID= /DNA_START= /DNA_END= /DNA_ORIENTATION=